MLGTRVRVRVGVRVRVLGLGLLLGLWFGWLLGRLFRQKGIFSGGYFLRRAFSPEGIISPHLIIFTSNLSTLAATKYLYCDRLIVCHPVAVE